MKLTAEQQKIVADNHNLIYWYINMKRLDFEEWYDLLAIELCKTVMHHDPSKSVLSTYFKIRADGLVYKEYTKQQTLKRAHENVAFIDNMHGTPDTDDLTDNFEIKEWMTAQDSEILRLRYFGHTQPEIARMLDVSQSYVSKTLKKLRKDYREKYENHR